MELKIFLPAALFIILSCSKGVDEQVSIKRDYVTLEDCRRSMKIDLSDIDKKYDNATFDGNSLACTTGIKAGTIVDLVEKISKIDEMSQVEFSEFLKSDLQYPIIIDVNWKRRRYVNHNQLIDNRFFIKEFRMRRMLRDIDISKLCTSSGDRGVYYLYGAIWMLPDSYGKARISYINLNNGEINFKGC